MKSMCYLVLGLALLMTYQSNPSFVLIILAVIGGLYLYFKRRKRFPKAMRRSGFLSPNMVTQNENPISNMLLMTVMTKDMLSSTEGSDSESKERNQSIDNVKNEIIKLLGD